MYEELLPIWKRRCKALRDGTVAELRYEWGKKLEALRKQGIFYEWFNGTSDQWQDCLIGGVMLFTWEQGIAE